MNKCKACVHNLVCRHLSDADRDFYDYDNCPNYKDNDTTPTNFVFIARDNYLKIVAPADLTLKQLLKQCDRIKSAWHDCGIKSDVMPTAHVEIAITYDSISKVDQDADCTILPEVTK